MTKNNKIENYFNTSKTTYYSLLKSSEKWKELFIEKESIVSFVLSFFSISLLYYFCGTNFGEEFNELMRGVSIEISMALIGLLGFTISGLAIFTGTITNKLVKNIDDDKKGNSIINILYSFYFIGGIDACEIFIFIVIHALSYSSKPFCAIATYIIFFVTIYLFLFIILYSVSLLGTCINLFLVSYKYYLEEIKDNDKKEGEK